MNIEHNGGYEQMTEAEFRVSRLVDGLGYGVGAISGGPESAPVDVLQKVDETIENDPRILVPIDEDERGIPIDDDGCGDGRGVSLVTRGTLTLRRSLNRAKIFGGGLVMGVAARIGLKQTGGKQLNELYIDVADELDEKDVNYGAHTDDHDHSNDDGSGCGAIDGTPKNIANAVVFEQQIRHAITTLGVDATGLDDVFDGYREYDAAINGQSFSGAQVSQVIRDRNKVIKQLAGSHQEKRIILNMVEGMTVNQELIRQVSGGQVQVFATDVWRLTQVAEKLAGNDPAGQNMIYLSELVYTLSVAGTLTDGSLPVYIIAVK